jgi:translocation and assembly module TamB
LITEDGRFRVKGFRKNQYENVIDGQIFVNGIAFIFSKEFNKYKDLFKKEVKEEKPKRERRKRKRDNNNESGK